MLYEEEPRFSQPRSDDSALDPRQLLKDIDALVSAGLVVPMRDRDGELRVIPTEPLELDAEAPAS